MTLQERIEVKIERLPWSGCWIWTGNTVQGYGVMMVNGKRNRKVHRLAFNLAGGVIPEGKQINHLCEVRCCVNPAHLEAVTPGENIRYSYRPEQHDAQRKSVCKRGHSRAITRKNRGCITCANEQQKLAARVRRALGRR